MGPSTERRNPPPRPACRRSPRNEGRCVAAKLSAYQAPCFLVVEPGGDVPSGHEYGLYYEDTRFLSHHALRLGGAAPVLLSARAGPTNVLVHYLTNPALPRAPRGTLVVRRVYAISHGMHVDLDITSYAPDPVELELELAYDADFADVFQVKRAIESADSGECERSTAGALGRSVIALARAEAGWSRRTEIRFSRRPRLDGRSARFDVALEPGGRFHLCQDVYTIAEGRFVPPLRLCTDLLPIESDERAALVRVEEVAPNHPTLETDWPIFDEAFERSIRDLYALRIHHLEGSEDEFHLAAGVPWFMSLFGRDSLIAAYQAMPYLPDLARGVLRSLARWQGNTYDPETEQEPGKILHENRAPDLLGSRSFVPRFPYYGSVDSTPLFVVTLSELWRRTGDVAFVRRLEPNLAAAVGWIVRRSSARPDGFLDYRRSTQYGLTNQGWKDSEDSVRFRDGRFAEPPIALVEVQGYAVDALRRAAELYRALRRDEREAAELEKRADLVAAAIDRELWLDDRSSWAMAIDGAGRRVDALVSNPAHLLWSGAARDDRIERACAVLTSDELLSGFGLRTMGLHEAAYNPISYHCGSVWPHDTSLAAAGLARAGRRREAALVCDVLLEALSGYQDRRLPELFAGFSRQDTLRPVDYPTANSPQAWAAGAVLLATTVTFGFEVRTPERKLVIRPCMPARLGRARLRNLVIDGAKVDLVLVRDGDRVTARADGVPDGFAVEIP